MNSEIEYLSTAEVKLYLKINDYDVKYLRTSGKIRCVKKGRGYLYIKSDVEKLKKLITSDS